MEKHSRIILLVLFFVVSQSHLAQTQVELKQYADQIEFGEIEVKRNALYELRNFASESASRVAVGALNDASEIVRATATHSVVFLPKAEATNALLPLLNEESRYVRRETCLSLGKVGNPAVVKILVRRILDDKEREVKTACAVAVGKIGSIEAIPALTSLLQKKRNKKNNFLRRASARSIGQIAQNLQNQVQTLTTPESFLPDKYKAINKRKYTKLIENFPVFQPANDVLVKLVQNNKEQGDVRREAAFALGEIGDPSSVNLLRKNLISKDNYLVEISKEALRKILKQ